MIKIHKIKYALLIWIGGTLAVTPANALDNQEQILINGNEISLSLASACNAASIDDVVRAISSGGSFSCLQNAGEALFDSKANLETQQPSGVLQGDLIKNSYFSGSALTAASTSLSLQSGKLEWDLVPVTSAGLDPSGNCTQRALYEINDMDIQLGLSSAQENLIPNFLPNQAAVFRNFGTFRGIACTGVGVAPQYLTALIEANGGWTFYWFSGAMAIGDKITSDFKIDESNQSDWKLSAQIKDVTANVILTFNADRPSGELNYNIGVYGTFSANYQYPAYFTSEGVTAPGSANWEDLSGHKIQCGIASDCFESGMAVVTANPLELAAPGNILLVPTLNPKTSTISVSTDYP